MTLGGLVPVQFFELRRLGIVKAVSIAGVLIGLPGLTQAQQTTQFPAAELSNAGDEPVSVVGSWTYSSSLVLDHFVEPVVALLNVSRYAIGDYSEWVPEDQQVLGRLLGPASAPPVSYVVDLPIRLRGHGVDLDNDGKDDPGVQILALVVASNLTGGSHLYQMDQISYSSYLTNPHSGAFRQGTFLVHAPDAEQGFPGSAGDDGQFFTPDDPIVTLPAGYTKATLRHDGSVTFDRSSVARLDTLEEVAAETPDFSSQGILESFQSLIDLLSVRYAYTDLRKLDWNAIREQYRPRVEAADAAADTAAYYAALQDLALSIRDAHVGVSITDAAAKVAYIVATGKPYEASLGARGLELSDGRFVVTALAAHGPAAEAGWKIGTQVISLNGTPIDKRINTMPLRSPAGNPESIRLFQAELALQFPEDERVEVAFRQPGDDTVRTATLTAVKGIAYQYVLDAQVSEAPGLIETRTLEGGIGYVTWLEFQDPAYVLAVWEKFLSDYHAAPGLVIDLRGNLGGNLELLYTMASYFFAETEPASWNWLDTYSYDEDANDLVKVFALNLPFYAPKSELRYDGAIVVLVDERSASAGEYFPQFLQRHGRAKIIGEHGTEGAGGPVEQALLPGNMAFHYTKGRTYFAGTDELNLEAKGVTLDVRVPVTLQSLSAKREGRDPVLEAAMQELKAEATRLAQDRLAGTTWRVGRVLSAPGGPSNPSLPSTYSITFDKGGVLSISTDCNQFGADYSLGENQILSITPRISTLAACLPGSKAEEFVSWLSAAESIQFDSSGLLILTATESGVVGMIFSSVD